MSSPLPSVTVSTRFMVISDTHNYEFGTKSLARVPFNHPLPKCDVLLHCGDLTMNGELKQLEGAIKMLGSIDAELKLVIAGNHERTLDGPYWRKYCGAAIPFRSKGVFEAFEDDNVADHTKAVEIMTGDIAKEAGVRYLEEGIHNFTLQNGANFVIYASPYQPEFCGYAFPYQRSEDRFNPREHIMEDVKEVEGVKVPDFPNVDIMMTHGPPMGILDPVYSIARRMTTHVGCDALMTACSRARPLLYCFGHIHEGHGANLVTWKDDKSITGSQAIAKEDDLPSVYPDILATSIDFGRQTLMLNAAIMDVNYWPKNPPWIVDLELPKA